MVHEMNPEKNGWTDCNPNWASTCDLRTTFSWPGGFFMLCMCYCHHFGFINDAYRNKQIRCSMTTPKIEEKKNRKEKTTWVKPRSKVRDLPYIDQPFFSGFISWTMPLYLILFWIITFNNYIFSLVSLLSWLTNYW
jgi:hypothetical protein